MRLHSNGTITKAVKDIHMIASHAIDQPRQQCIWALAAAKFHWAPSCVVYDGPNTFNLAFSGPNTACWCGTPYFNPYHERALPG
jgi:hypothetical protein